MLMHNMPLVFVMVLMWDSSARAGPAAVKVCGRNLGEMMSKVCNMYNSPSWDVPTVIEQPTSIVRRKRQSGIADECCTRGCTLYQLSLYCARTNLETPFDSMEAHLIEDRSAEGGSSVSSPAMVGQEATSQREVGRARTRGYGRGRGRRRLCACRRKRRRGSPTGNMNLVRNAARAAPVVGTVSPLLTWGRTLNTDLPSVKRDRYAYVSV
ncbi:insulin-like growth factor I [Leptidea sinapis]|uniref:insulin-like growth factor I n=1 Tax=Leptidea sinapis TaxID=189913 RepID=UPI0021C43096|nr:insulin-like growth factor I [Leptidea sinapis]